MQHATDLDRNFNLMGKLCGVGQIDEVDRAWKQKSHSRHYPLVELASSGAHKPSRVRAFLHGHLLGSKWALGKQGGKLFLTRECFQASPGRCTLLLYMQ